MTFKIDHASRNGEPIANAQKVISTPQEILGIVNISFVDGRARFIAAPQIAFSSFNNLRRVPEEGKFNDKPEYETENLNQLVLIVSRNHKGDEIMFSGHEIPQNSQK